MNYILFDDTTVRNNLLPFTFTRPVADIRIGILTIREKWEKYLKKEVSVKTEEYLSKKFPLVLAKKEDNVWIDASVCPDKKIFDQIKALKPLQALTLHNKVIACNTGAKTMSEVKDFKKRTEIKNPVFVVEKVTDIFSKNGDALKADFELLTKGKRSQPLSKTNTVLGGKNIFLEKGAKVEGAILNGTTGPVYIAKDAEVMEGSIIRGPFALCEHSALKLGAKIYGPTTIGPHSKVGGEINNSVIFGCSNKAHDGFLGNSVIGEWCNIGADSNNSNLKNNYAEVKIWRYSVRKFVNTGLQFCGLIMGDHSKCGINTMFNTGTVVGVNANIFGAGFPRNFIPDFSWGGPMGFTTYGLPSAFETAEKVFERRGKRFDYIEKNILSHVFEITAEFRR